ncbi:MAG: DUF4124 domain-containing protein [Wenzhouxiangellaceae bacterium]|nr:DUF4124 domain-containing protein [Wenzhouxiangellaceae bacterium]
MHTRNLLLILALIALSTTLAAQSFYKWVDDQGTVHFSSEPPLDRDYETINTTGRVLGSTAPAAAPAIEAAPEPAAQMPRQRAPDPELIAARCQQARENLFWLQAKRRIVVERDDGSEEFIDAEEQQKMAQQSQALIDEWCQDDGNQ